MNIKRFLTKQIIVISLSIFCLLAVIISTSYASFTSSSGTVARTISSGDLDISFEKGSTIQISPVPLTETEVVDKAYNNPNDILYKFTITNNGDLVADYRIDLHSTFEDDNTGLHYLQYFFGTDEQAEDFMSYGYDTGIIEQPDIDIYFGMLTPGSSKDFYLYAWMLPNIPSEFQGKNASIKIDIKSHVKQYYRGLDEAIKEDNLIRETTTDLTEDFVNSLNKTDFYIFNKSEEPCPNSKPTYFSTGYTFDETTGMFKLDDYNLNDYYQGNDFIYDGTYRCFYADGQECNFDQSVIYYSNYANGECIRYFISNNYSYAHWGLYKNGDTYKFVGDKTSNLNLNNVSYIIDSIDADGYITFKESGAPQSLNWFDLTVSGKGTYDDPYYVYNG